MHETMRPDRISKNSNYLKTEPLASIHERLRLIANNNILNIQLLNKQKKEITVPPWTLKSSW